jgi:hypothetical protein
MKPGSTKSCVIGLLSTISLMREYVFWMSTMFLSPLATVRMILRESIHLVAIPMDASLVAIEEMEDFND